MISKVSVLYKHQHFDHFSLVELEARAEDQEREFEKSQPRTYRLLVAIAYMLISHSELLCYFLMILDQMVYGSLLSLPLPFMVFLWGMLSVPRPSKTFWITVITYTEVPSSSPRLTLLSLLQDTCSWGGRICRN